MTGATERVGRSAVPGRAWLVLGAVSLCSFQTSLSLSIMNVAFPSLRDSFPDARPTTLSWVLNLYTIVAAASLVVAGVMGDRLGRKRVLLWGVAGFAASSAACALAPNVPLLLAGRVAQALFSAFVTPVSAALIVRAFPDEHRASAVGFWAATGSLAAATGPSLGAVLVDWGGWPWAFWINLPGALVGFVLTALVVRESKDPTPRPVPDLLGAVLIMVSVSSVIVGLTQSRNWGWGDPRVAGFVVAGGAVGALLARRSLRHPTPILDLTLLRYANFRLANIASMFFGVGFFSMFFGYVLFLTDVWQYEIRTAGLLMTPVPLCGALVSPFVGRMSQRYGPKALLVPGGVVVASGGLLLIVAAGPEPNVTGVWLPAMTLIGIGSAVVWPCVFGGVLIGLPAERFAVATGINQTIQRTSTALGVALAVTLLGRTDQLTGTGNFDRVFALTVLGGLAASLIGARFKDEAAFAR